ncbi:MAG: potassium-transporting ATPase subunit KdpC [Pseudomonadota bacterium]|nr:potassium-transporting ATPase subunit KdpC [Pseudomonadota bacterium]
MRASFGLVLLMTLLLGGAYPLAVMGVARALFHHKANGSLIEKDGKVVGSELLGQQFDSPKYFWGRLSATTPPYNAAASGGSNFSPANPALLAAANARLKALQQADPGQRARVPVDLVTASGSGIDPHISLKAAQYQLPRVARARRMKEEDVRAIMEKYVERPGFGLIGAPYVNVVRLNLALDRESGAR